MGKSVEMCCVLIYNARAMEKRRVSNSYSSYHQDVIDFLYQSERLKRNPFIRYESDKEGKRYCAGVLLQELARYANREELLPESLRSSASLIFKDKKYEFDFDEKTYRVNGKNYSLFGFLLLHGFRNYLTDLIKIPAFRNAIKGVINDDLLRQIVGKKDLGYFTFLQEKLGESFDEIFKDLYEKLLTFSADVEMSAPKIFAWLIDQQDKFSLDEKKAEELKNYILGHYQNDLEHGYELLALLGIPDVDEEDFYEELSQQITDASKVSYSKNASPPHVGKKSFNTVDKNETSEKVKSTVTPGTSGMGHSPRTESRGRNGGGRRFYDHRDRTTSHAITNDGAAKKESVHPTVLDEHSPKKKIRRADPIYGSSDFPVGNSVDKTKEDVQNSTLFSSPLSVPTSLKYQQVPGDGHCLYHAVALYTGLDQQTLRNTVATAIEEDPERFRNFIPLPAARTLQDYIHDIRSGAEWAGNIEILVLMQALNRPIVVIGPEGRIRNRIDIGGFSGDPIFVFYNDHNHYDALLLENNYTSRSRELLNQLLANEQAVSSADPRQNINQNYPQESLKNPISRDSLEMDDEADAPARSVDERSPALDSDSGSEDSDWNENKSESTPTEWEWKNLEGLIKPGQKYLMHCRGVHCFRQNSHDNPAYFSFSSKEARKLFLSETKTNPLLLSPVLYTFYKESSVSERKNFLEQKAREVTQAYQSLTDGGEIEIKDYNNSGEKRKFKNRQAFFNQLFTNSYDRHAATLKAESDPTNPFRPTYPFTQHPFVCMTDTPEHALRYAYGQKVSGDRWEDRLRPRYGNDGLAKHCHAGVLYVTLHEASKYQNALKRHVLAAYANNEVDIHVRIVNERETSFVANVDADNIVLILPIKYPSFLKYNKCYHDRFGIDQSKFDEFKRRIEGTLGTDEHRKVKDDIIAHVSEHLINKLKTHLKENIERCSGQLVYASLWGGTQEALPSLQAAKALRHYVKLQNTLRDWLKEPNRWQDATVAKYAGLAQLCSLFLSDSVREELNEAPTERYSCLHEFIKACEENRESCATIQQQQLEKDKSLIGENNNLLSNLFKYRIEHMPCSLEGLDKPTYHQLHQCFDALERLESEPAKLEGNLTLLVQRYIKIKDYLAEFQRAWDGPHSPRSGNVQAAHLRRIGAGNGTSTQEASVVSVNVSREPQPPIKLKSPFERLLEAIQQNNLKDIERFVRYQIVEKPPGSGVYEAEKDGDGNTALHHGIRRNNEEIVSRLLHSIPVANEHGKETPHWTSLVCANNDNNKPLDLAAINGNVGIMEQLLGLRPGMGIDYRSLKLAVEGEHKDAVVFLLEKCADFRLLTENPEDLAKISEPELQGFLKDLLLLYGEICKYIKLVDAKVRCKELGEKFLSLKASLTIKERITVVQVMRKTHHDSAVGLQKSMEDFLEKHSKFSDCRDQEEGEITGKTERNKAVSKIVQNLCEIFSEENKKPLISYLIRDGENEFIAYLSSLGVTFSRLSGRYRNRNSPEIYPITLAVMKGRNRVVDTILDKNPDEYKREYQSKPVVILAKEKKKEYKDLKNKVTHPKVRDVLGESYAVILEGVDEKIEAYEKIIKACEKARILVVGTPRTPSLFFKNVPQPVSQGIPSELQTTFNH